MARYAPSLGQRRRGFLQEVLLIETISIRLFREVVFELEVLATCCQEGALCESFQVVGICEIKVGLVLDLADSLVLQLLNLSFACRHEAHGQ